MPRANETIRDTTAADGSIFRTCVANVTHANPVTLPLTEDNFFHRRRTNGVLWIDGRCQACRREVDRRNRRARAAGSPVRPRRARQVSNRSFGIEIEFAGASYSSVLREMRTRGLDAAYEGYSHRIRRGQWKIVTDGSLSSGYELVSPPLRGEDGFSQLERACEALQAAGATINRQCGLHVHHGVRTLDAPAFGRLVDGWSRNQGNTDWLVAASRRGSQWCRPLQPAEVRLVQSAPANADATGLRPYVRIDRYRSLNVSCFARYGTVEIRQHQGTLNATKIAAWVKFGQAVIQAADAGGIPTADTAHGFIDILQIQGGLDADTATYLKGRADHFQGRRSVAAAA